MEISIIVPAFNEEKYIERCLKSIDRQTFPRKKYEIIVSDGGSSDMTVKIAKKYADKVVVTKKRGIWFGRNFGARYAKGKYLLFVDSDTNLKRRYLSEIYPYLKKGYVGVSTGFGLLGKDEKVLILEEVANYYWRIYSTLRRNPLIGFNVAVPKKVFNEIGGFKNCHMEDEQLNKDLISQGKIIFLNERLVVTSARRLEEYGFFGICRYYFELFLIDNHIIDPCRSRLLKNKGYKPVGKS